MHQKFSRTILPNGLTLLIEQRDLPVVSIAIATRYGGYHESLMEKGIAHFIEHMLYKGTRLRNAHDISSAIERNGGVLNGFTDELLTAFWCKIPSRHALFALEVLTDMVLHPSFDSKELEKERKVIFEEIRMRKDSPHIFVNDELQRALYEPPFGNPLIGTEQTLSSLTRKDLIQNHSKWYGAENLIVCVVGNVSKKEVVDFVSKKFTKTSEVSIPSSPTFKPKTLTYTRKDIDQAHLALGIKMPLSTEKNYVAALVLSTLLGSGMSSRLFSEIREKRNLVYTVRSDCVINRYFSYLSIYAGMTPQNIPLVKELILKELNSISKKLSSKEIDSVKQQIIGNTELSEEDSVSQLSNLLSFEIDGNAENFYKMSDKILAVTPKQVQELAKVTSYGLVTLTPQ